MAAKKANDDMLLDTSKDKKLNRNVLKAIESKHLKYTEAVKDNQLQTDEVSSPGCEELATATDS